jgi:uncharacterized protein (TIGR00159 family)
LVQEILVRWKVGNFLDFFVVFILVYFFILLLKRTRSTSIIIGFLFLAILYAIGVLFNLTITQAIFKSFFGFFVVIIAIIFQKELRRFFELFNFLGLRKRRLFFPTIEKVIKIIIDSLNFLAARKIGAIIVFPGRENIEKFLDGGFELNGKLSKPLLLSLFDPTSPGHDGAVIIEGDRVRKFGVHLPLAENIKDFNDYGTRHRAALGLSENTDALVVVLSEEKGSISVAYGGELVTIQNYSELENRIINFLSTDVNKDNNRYLVNFKYFITEYLPVIFLSLLISLSVMVFVSLKQEVIVQKQIVLPLEFENIPSGYIITEAPREVLVTITGRKADFELLSNKDLAVSLNASDVRPGYYSFSLEERNIRRPKMISVVQIRPQLIRVRVESVLEKK